MSAALLQNPSKRHTYADDLESFLHVTMLTVLRYSPSSFSEHPARLIDYLAIFDQQVKPAVPGGYETGGFQKANQIVNKYVPDDLHFHNRPALGPLLTEVADLFWPLYGPDRHFKVLYNKTTRAEEEAKLNTWVDGGQKFYDAFDNALHPSVSWPENDAAKRVHIPTPGPISSHKETRERKRTRAISLQHASTASSMGNGTPHDGSIPSKGNTPHDSPHPFGHPPLLAHDGDGDGDGDGDNDDVHERPGKKYRTTRE